MLETVLLKMLDKAISKLTSPEDLLFMSIALLCGILMTQWLRKYLQKKEPAKKPEKSEKPISIEDAMCPLTNQPPKCKEVPKITAELRQIVHDNTDIKNRCAKIMNVLSKEYDGRWDRYLYDRDVTPREDDVRIPDNEE